MRVFRGILRIGCNSERDEEFLDEALDGEDGVACDEIPVGLEEGADTRAVGDRFGDGGLSDAACAHDGDSRRVTRVRRGEDKFDRFLDEFASAVEMNGRWW